MDIYERYGRKQAALEDALDEHAKTLQLLMSIKGGATRIEDVFVTPQGWSVRKPIAADGTVSDGSDA